MGLHLHSSVVFQMLVWAVVQDFLCAFLGSRLLACSSGILSDQVFGTRVTGAHGFHYAFKKLVRRARSAATAIVLRVSVLV